MVSGLPWGPVSPPYTEGLAPVGDVWTHAGMWCYCRGGPARRASCPALLRMGGLSAWMLAFAEGRLGGWGRRKPKHTPPPLLSPQHISSLLAVGPNDQHLPMHHPLTGSSSQSWLGLTRTRSLDPLDRHWGPRDAKRQPGPIRPQRAGIVPGTPR